MERTRATSRGDRSRWSWMTNGLDLGDLGLIDRALVNVNEGREVTYWTAIFQCTTAQLLEAIAAVGTKPEWVKAYLKKEKVAPDQT